MPASPVSDHQFCSISFTQDRNLRPDSPVQILPAWITFFTTDCFTGIDPSRTGLPSINKLTYNKLVVSYGNQLSSKSGIWYFLKVEEVFSFLFLLRFFTSFSISVCANFSSLFTKKTTRKQQSNKKKNKDSHRGRRSRFGILFKSIFKLLLNPSVLLQSLMERITAILNLQVVNLLA